MVFEEVDYGIGQWGEYYFYCYFYQLVEGDYFEDGLVFLDVDEGDWVEGEVVYVLFYYGRIDGVCLQLVVVGEQFYFGYYEGVGEVVDLIGYQ